MIHLNPAANGSAVFNPADVATLRTQYRIVGRLCGSHAVIPRQNNMLSVPLFLSPYETTLLLDKGFATLYREQPTVTEHIKERECKYMEHLEVSYEEQKVLALAQKCSDMKLRTDQIVSGLLKKQGKSAAEATETEKREMMESVISGIKPISRESMLVQQPIETPWSSQRIEAPWNFPKTDKEHLLYSVYKHLWQDGYYVTPGAKFGGDFLVYEGDPGLFHSRFIIHCIADPSEVTPHDAVSLARLASNVKKTAVVCHYNRHNDNLTYSTISYQPK